ncbi:MAG: hypothetical protein IAE78_33255 [Myxococcus sp.]|nr:hypothetical protein [Myxococcus sp.]
MRLLPCLVVASLVACSPGTRTITPDDVVARGDCPAVMGAGTPHTMNVTANETWTAAGSPHVVSSLRVEATLTLEPCAVVVLKKGAVITVGNSGAGPAGKVVAGGTFDGVKLEPVVFRAETAGERWASLFVQETGSLDFSYTALSSGGSKDASSSNATIEARGTQMKPLQKKLGMKYVVIRDSGSQGITLRGYSAFTDASEKLFISGSGAEPEADARFFTGFPLDIQPGGVGTIPRDSVLTGNRRDAIYIRSVVRLDVDETFPNRGVPYVFNGAFLMYDLGMSTPTLTIEPGVTLKFEKNTGGSLGMTLGNKASMAPVRLVARGTATAPIVFTSAEATPAAGDWGGLYLANGPADGNALEYATIEYAGGTSGARGFGCGPMANVGGLLLIDWRPNDAFVKNCTFKHLIGAGIVSGWNSDQAGPDLSASNTFSSIADVPMEGRCNVTKWAPAAGVGSCAMRPVCVN